MAVHCQMKAATYINEVPIFSFKQAPNTSKYLATSDEPDFIDEVFRLYRANVLHKSFTFESNEDKLMAYVILYMTQILTNIQLHGYTKMQAQQYIVGKALDAVPVPGDSNYVFKVVYKPCSAADRTQLVEYFKHLRYAVSQHLLSIVYAQGEQPDKFWVMFSKYDFAGYKL